MQISSLNGLNRVSDPKESGVTHYDNHPKPKEKNGTTLVKYSNSDNIKYNILRGLQPRTRYIVSRTGQIVQ